MSRPSVPDPVTIPSVRVETLVGALWLSAHDQVMLPYLRNAGIWEPAEHRLLDSLMRDDTRFLDVGANVGYFSVMAARRCPKGTIDAVEPEPGNLALLRMNLWQHAPHAVVWPLALAASRGVAALRIDEVNRGNTRLGDEAVATALAAVASGDEAFPGRVFDVIKLDVQGFELEVLRGLRGVLRNSPRAVVVAEFFPGAIVDRGLQPLEILAGYRELGLHVATCLGEKLLPMDDRETLDVCTRAGPDGFVNLVLRKAG